MPYRASKNCSELLDPNLPDKNCRNDPSRPENTVWDCSKLLKVAQIGSKWHKVRDDVLAYTGAKVVITWHCCCRCLLLHGLKVSVNGADVMPAVQNPQS